MDPYNDAVIEANYGSRLRSTKSNCHRSDTGSLVFAIFYRLSGFAFERIW